MKLPFAETVRLSPPLFCRTTDPAAGKPLTVPPMVYSIVGAVQVSVTLVTFAMATVPLPMPTVQVAPPVGCVSTVTA